MAFFQPDCCDKQLNCAFITGLFDMMHKHETYRINANARELILMVNRPTNILMYMITIIYFVTARKPYSKEYLNVNISDRNVR